MSANSASRCYEMASDSRYYEPDDLYVLKCRNCDEIFDEYDASMNELIEDSPCPICPKAEGFDPDDAEYCTVTSVRNPRYEY